MLHIAPPNTLSGIKSYASLLKKEQGVPHHTALDLAASAAGFENWTHAVHVRSHQPNQAVHWCQIWTVWRDWVDTKTAGWEHHWMPLKRPLVELVRNERALSAPFLSGYHLEGKNCLIDRSGYVHRQSTAQWFAARAARTLQFMEATGLRPSRSRRRVHPQGKRELEIPDHDHATTWFDPGQRKYVYIDEPYGNPISEDRTRWAVEHGRQIIRPAWGGMHNPEKNGTQALLVAELDYDLSGLSRKLSSLEQDQTAWRTWSRPCAYY